jgi:hypothetical protein
MKRPATSDEAPIAGLTTRDCKGFMMAERHHYTIAYIFIELGIALALVTLLAILLRGVS